MCLSYIPTHIYSHFKIRRRSGMLEFKRDPTGAGLMEEKIVATLMHTCKFLEMFLKKRVEWQRSFFFFFKSSPKDIFTDLREKERNTDWLPPIHGDQTCKPRTGIKPTTFPVYGTTLQPTELPGYSWRSFLETETTASSIFVTTDLWTLLWCGLDSYSCPVSNVSMFSPEHVQSDWRAL